MAINDEIARKLVSSIVDNEYETAKNNNRIPDNDYLSYLDMFDCERTEKNYDWMSDIFFPEFFSQINTQSSIEAGLYFKTHNFVDVYIGSENELHQRAAKASKDLINKTLNRRELYYYQKYMRAVTMKNIGGATYFRCWWEQKTRKDVIGTRREVRDLDVDIFGNDIIDRDLQVPRQEFEDIDIEGDIVLHDQFNFDTMDSRDVFTDASYEYSLQDQKWVILRFNQTKDELETDKESMEYFNLDKLIDSSVLHTTETKGDRTTHHGLDNKQEPAKTPLKDWMILERYGKHWVMVEDKDPDGNPTKVRVGIGEDGKKKVGAELHEMVISFALNGQQKHLIRYQPVRTIDANGRPYRPIIRLLCYIHPAKADGVGDGRCAKELQIGINDSLNLASDRLKIATLPIQQGNEFDITDNDTLVWEPGAFWQTETKDKITEVKVSDNVTGMFNLIDIYKGGMQQGSGVSLQTQSILGAPTTTATATANQAQRADTRSNYRLLTAENTGMAELYWMITQMSAQFMRLETAKKILGDRFVDFNPTLDFTYKPVSASIDTDESKQAKIKQWTQVLGYIINDPERRQGVDAVLNELAELMGKEFEAFGKKFFADVNAPPLAGGGAGRQQVTGGGAPATNQTGAAQTGAEISTRELANV